MEMMIEATSLTSRLNGVPIRLWNATTKDGTKCKLLVAEEITATHAKDKEILEDELKELLPKVDHDVPLSYLRGSGG